MKHLTYSIAFFTLILFSACGDSAFSPIGEEPSAKSTTAFGIVEVTISGIGTEQMTASAKPVGSNVAYNLTAPAGSDGTIQLESLSNGSFTTGTRGVDGFRYIYATFKVRNADVAGTAYGDVRQNLTLLAVDTDASFGEDQTYGITAVSMLRLFDGTELTGTAAQTIAEAAIPTGAVYQQSGGQLLSIEPDVLQVLTETEAGAVTAPAGVEVFPYGFMTRSPNTTPGSRELSANPGTNQFDGLVTFAFKLPLQAQANQDPFEISAMFLPVDDSETRMTQSLEEQMTGGNRQMAVSAAALNAETITIFPGSVYQGVFNLICGPVRITGPEGAPATVLFPEPPVFNSLAPNPYASDGSASHILATTDFSAMFSGPVSNANASTFVVRGRQSGIRFVGDTYGGPPGIVTTPIPAPGFFPGELVEVSLTPGLGICTEQVARYRVATGSGAGAFLAGSYPAGNGPFAITAGDLDDDSDLDLVTASSASDKILVLLNTGTGTGDFAPAVPYPAGSTPQSIIAGDLDGDGDLDLAVTNNMSDNISVMLNTGTGTFASPVSYAAGDSPRDIATGDLDGDGDLDLAATNEFSNDISVWLNIGTGAFALASAHTVGNNPRDITVGDLDGDGDLDLAATNSVSNNISVLLNTGAGTFASAVPYSAGTEPIGITAGDLDGDGDLDLVTANRGSDNILVLLNTGAGAFASAVPYSVGTDPMGITAGDWNGDGDLDLAVVNRGSDNMSVLRNNGDGIFVTDGTYEMGSLPRGITSGDWDGNGNLDLAATNISSDNIYVLDNQ